MNKFFPGQIVKVNNSPMTSLRGKYAQILSWKAPFYLLRFFDGQDDFWQISGRDWFFLGSELTLVETEVPFQKHKLLANQFRKATTWYSYENLPVELTPEQIEIWEQELDYQFDCENRNRLSGLPPIIWSSQISFEPNSESEPELTEDQLYDIYFTYKTKEFRKDFQQPVLDLEESLLGFQPSWTKVLTSLGVILSALSLAALGVHISSWLVGAILPMLLISMNFLMLYTLRDPFYEKQSATSKLRHLVM